MNFYSCSLFSACTVRFYEQDLKKGFLRDVNIDEICLSCQFPIHQMYTESSINMHFGIASPQIPALCYTEHVQLN